MAPPLAAPRAPDTRVPGGAMPSSSSLSYVPCRVPAVISRLGRSMDSCTRLPCFFSSVCGVWGEGRGRAGRGQRAGRERWVARQGQVQALGG